MRGWFVSCVSVSALLWGASADSHGHDHDELSEEMFTISKEGTLTLYEGEVDIQKMAAMASLSGANELVAVFEAGTQGALDVYASLLKVETNLQSTHKLDEATTEAAEPAVTGIDGGGFAAAWVSDTHKVMMGVYDNSAGIQGSVVQLDELNDTFVGATQLSMASMVPSAGSSADEVVFVAWTRNENAEHRHIYARMVKTADRTFVGGDEDNDDLIDISHNANTPRIAALTEDDLFVIAVTDEDSDGHIFGFLFDKDGVKFNVSASDHDDDDHSHSAEGVPDPLDDHDHDHGHPDDRLEAFEIDIDLDDELDVTCDVVPLMHGHFAVVYPNEDTTENGKHGIYANFYDGHGHICDEKVLVTETDTPIEQNPRAFYVSSSDEYSVFAIAYEKQIGEGDAAQMNTYEQMVAAYIASDHCEEDEHSLTLIGDEMLIAEAVSRNGGGAMARSGLVSGDDVTSIDVAFVLDMASDTVVGQVVNVLIDEHYEVADDEFTLSDGVPTALTGANPTGVRQMLEIAALETNGEYVAVYESGADADSLEDVYVSILTADGGFQSAVMLDAADTSASKPVVTGIDGGGFAVAWVSDTHKVMMGVYDKAGTIDGSAVELDELNDTFVGATQLSMASMVPSAGSSADEVVFVAWTRNENAEHRHIYARMVKTNDRDFVGDEENDYLIDVSHNANTPRIAALTEDDLFVISVTDEDSMGHIFGFLFDTNGVKFNVSETDHDHDHSEEAAQVSPASDHDHDHEHPDDRLQAFEITTDPLKNELNITSDVVALSQGHFAVVYTQGSDDMFAVYADLFDGHGHGCDDSVQFSEASFAVDQKPRVFFVTTYDEYDIFVVTYQRKSDADTINLYGQLVGARIESDHCEDGEHEMTMILDEFTIAEDVADDTNSGGATVMATELTRKFVVGMSMDQISAEMYTLTMVGVEASTAAPSVSDTPAPSVATSAPTASADDNDNDNDSSAVAASYPFVALSLIFAFFY